MAKSHETRQFSYMQVVDGPAVTFSLVLDFFSLSFLGGKEEKKNNCKTLPDARARPCWRIGENSARKRGIFAAHEFVSGLGN